jgi:hypothetical protein
VSLNPNADRMKRVGFDQECLDAIERAMGANLSPAQLSASQREEEAKQRAAMKREREELLALADKAEAGGFGPEVKEAALEILSGHNGGRSDFNLTHLRTAIRRLK